MRFDSEDAARQYWLLLHLFGTEERCRRTHELHKEAHRRFPWAVTLSPESLLAASSGVTSGLMCESIASEPAESEAPWAALYPLYNRWPAPEGDAEEAPRYRVWVERVGKAILSHPDVFVLVHRAIRDDDLIMSPKRQQGLRCSIELTVTVAGDSRTVASTGFAVGPDTPPRYVEKQIGEFLRRQRTTVPRLALSMLGGAKLKGGGRPRRPWYTALECHFFRDIEGEKWSEVAAQIGLAVDDVTLRNYARHGRRLVSSLAQ